ncbi:hypothetical protein ACSS6W_002542 [Trichoderma asperelloides]
MDAFFSGIAPRKHSQSLAAQMSRKKINARFEMWLNAYFSEAMVHNSDVVTVKIWIDEKLRM